MFKRQSVFLWMAFRVCAQAKVVQFMFRGRSNKQPQGGQLLRLMPQGFRVYEHTQSAMRF